MSSEKKPQVPTGRVLVLKERCEKVLGKSLDPWFDESANTWEFRYVNHAGRHLFSIRVRHTGNAWRINSVSDNLLTGELFEQN